MAIQSITDFELDLSAPYIFSPIYIPVIESRHRYILMYGGRDSAKSFTAAQKMVKTIVEEPYAQGVCLRKHSCDIKDSQFETIWSVIETWGLTQYFKYIKSPLEITFLVNGNKIIARGLDKPSKMKSIKDPTIVWGEEIDEIDFQSFLKSDTSIRGSDYLVFMLTFNPEDQGGWINRHFFPHHSTYEKADGNYHYVESIQDDTLILHTKYDDNIYCPKERGKRYRALKHLADENYYKVYCLGLWGNALKGLIFDKVNYCDEFPKEEDCKKLFYGMDFGFTNDPTTLIKIAVCHGELYFQELIYKTGLTNIINTNNPEQDSIEQELRDLKFHTFSHTIWADSAEPKSIQDLNNCGFNVCAANKGPDSIKNGIDIIKRYPINIVGSPNMRKEQRKYKWKENKDGTFSNKPVDMFNHCWDASRYGCSMELESSGGAFVACSIVESDYD